MKMKSDRRKFIICTLSAAIAGSLPGCTEKNDQDIGYVNNMTAPRINNETTLSEDTSNGYIGPKKEFDKVPMSLICDEYEDFLRYSSKVDKEYLNWGDIVDEDNSPLFTLRVNDIEFKRGEIVKITLTNVSDYVQEIGNPNWANFDVFTENGWQDVRGFTDGEPKPITLDQWRFEPGEQHKWRFEFTESGVLDAGYEPHKEDIAVCPGLPLGRYRFATSAIDQGDVAVAFDLVE